LLATSCSISAMISSVDLRRVLGKATAEASACSAASSAAARGELARRVDSRKLLGFFGACFNALARAAFRLSESAVGKDGKVACEGLGGAGGGWDHAGALGFSVAAADAGVDDATLGCSDGVAVVTGNWLGCCDVASVGNPGMGLFVSGATSVPLVLLALDDGLPESSEASSSVSSSGKAK